MITETHTRTPSNKHVIKPPALRKGRQWCDGCGDQVDTSMLMGWNGLKCCGDKHVVVGPHEKMKETCFSCFLKHTLDHQEKGTRSS